MSHAFATAGKYFVRIGLVSYIPDDTIIGRIEDRMQGNSEFYRTQIRGQMSAGFRDGLQDKLAQLHRDLFEFAPIQLAQIGRRLNLFKRNVGHTSYRVVSRQHIRPSTITASGSMRKST